MSEIKKNIETCRGEDVLAEVSALPQDPHFGSLVNEALDPLKQQAMHQAGYDGYSEVIDQHKPYTFASAIIQMKSNLLLLLRALWMYPFGAGTLRSLSDDASLRSLSDAAPRSLSDMWQHYITRLSGDPEHGIPSRLSSLTDLPSAPLLVSDRKISGVPDAADGISLVQLISTQYSTITELRDSTKGWTLSNGKIFDTFPNLQKLTIGCRTIQGINKSIANLTELEFTDAETLVLNNNVFYNVDIEEFVCPIKRVERGSNSYCYFISGTPNLKRVKLPELEGGPIGTNGAGFINGDGIEEIDMSKAGDLQNYSQDGLGALPNIKIFRLGKITRWVGFAMWRGSYDSEHFWSVPANLIHYEIGADTTVSINLSGWNPTNALDASRTDLIEEGSTAANNLEQFLKNFRTYIALRLADNGSGKTLTLSAAVFSSIWDANGNPQVLQDGLDQLRADIHNIVKTTKHWDVNKAN